MNFQKWEIFLAHAMLKIQSSVKPPWDLNNVRDSIGLEKKGARREWTSSPQMTNSDDKDINDSVLVL